MKIFEIDTKEFDFERMVEIIKHDCSEWLNETDSDSMAFRGLDSFRENIMDQTSVLNENDWLTVKPRSKRGPLDTVISIMHYSMNWPMNSRNGEKDENH